MPHWWVIYAGHQNWTCLLMTPAGSWALRKLPHRSWTMQSERALPGSRNYKWNCEQRHLCWGEFSCNPCGRRERLLSWPWRHRHRCNQLNRWPQAQSSCLWRSRKLLRQWGSLLFHCPGYCRSNLINPFFWDFICNVFLYVNVLPWIDLLIFSCRATPATATCLRTSKIWLFELSSSTAGLRWYLAKIGE